MRKVINKIRKRSKKVYIYKLTSTGAIPYYVNEQGFKEYDTDDLKAYKKTRKLGRPIKQEQAGGNDNE